MRCVGDFTLQWGESLRWDARRGRLYFVDCAAQRLCWLDEGDETLRGVALPSIPTGIALAASGRVLVNLADGPHLLDPDTGRAEKLADNPAPSPEPRLNDAAADRDGNLVTGSLGFGHDPVGAWWQLSSRGAWRELERGVSDANGPVVTPDGGTLLCVDTAVKAVHRYDYDAARGAVSRKTVLADTGDLPGLHDGAALDGDGRYWSTLTGGSLVVAVAPDGAIGRRVPLPVDYPTSLAFGGPARDRLYVTSVSMTLGPVQPRARDAGRLLVVTGLGVTGAPEPRFGA